jgi:natural resistance-associated macrophage protein 2
MTGTLAGQYVIEGYFGKIFSKQWHRVVITRGIALVPSMLVAIFAVSSHNIVYISFYSIFILFLC